jgi:hypothetical protein
MITHMTNRIQSISISTWFVVSAFLLALGLAVVLFSSAYDQKRRALMSTGEDSEEPRQYFKVPIADMPINHYTHVEITGEVKRCMPEKDGDMHIQISDGTNFVIAECIPKLPCSVIPNVGQTVTVRGISRYDRENRWYEVHPVEEIELQK